MAATCTISSSKNGLEILLDGALWAMGSMVETAPDIVLYGYWNTKASLMRMQRFRVGAEGLQPLNG